MNIQREENETQFADYMKTIKKFQEICKKKKDKCPFQNYNALSKIIEYLVNVILIKI